MSLYQLWWVRVALAGAIVTLGAIAVIHSVQMAWSPWLTAMDIALTALCAFTLVPKGRLDP